MTTLASPLSLPFSLVEPVQALDLHCFTYDDRGVVLDGMLKALNQAGCWLESRRAISPWEIEVYFGAMLGSIDEVYAGLIEAGVEMPRDTHRAMTSLCTLRRHSKDAAAAPRTVAIRLEMHFLNEPQEEMGFVAAGMA